MDDPKGTVVDADLYWEEMVYSEEEEGGVTPFGRNGSILAIDRCRVTGKWHILVIGHDNRLHSLEHDDPTIVYVGDD
jgi:hypothetical protein